MRLGCGASAIASATRCFIPQRLVGIGAEDRCIQLDHSDASLGHRRRIPWIHLVLCNQRIGHLLVNREHRVQGVERALHHDRELGPSELLDDPRVLGQQVVTIEGGAAAPNDRWRTADSKDGLHERGLSAPGLAHHADDLAGMNRETHTLHDPLLAIFIELRDVEVSSMVRMGLLIRHHRSVSDSSLPSWEVTRPSLRGLELRVGDLIDAEVDEGQPEGDHRDRDPGRDERSTRPGQQGRVVRGPVELVPQVTVPMSPEAQELQPHLCADGVDRGTDEA